MQRTGLYASVATFTVLATALSGATSHARAASVRASAPDRTCQNLIKSRNRFSYPPDANWVWTIPSGCVFIRDRTATDNCPAPDCAPPPDVHVRYLRRNYVFHLTQQGLPATTKGLYRAARRLVAATDGRAAKDRRRLVIDFTATEFRGTPDLGPLRGQHLWRISVTVDKRKGLCCRPNDPGNPGTAWDVAPLF